MMRSIEISTEMWAALEELAKRTARSRGVLVRDMLYTHLKTVADGQTLTLKNAPYKSAVVALPPDQALVRTEDSLQPRLTYVDPMTGYTVHGALESHYVIEPGRDDRLKAQVNKVRTAVQPAKKKDFNAVPEFVLAHNREVAEEKEIAERNNLERARRDHHQ